MKRTGTVRFLRASVYTYSSKSRSKQALDSRCYYVKAQSRWCRWCQLKSVRSASHKSVDLDHLIRALQREHCRVILMTRVPSLDGCVLSRPRPRCATTATARTTKSKLGENLRSLALDFLAVRYVVLVT